MDDKFKKVDSDQRVKAFYAKVEKYGGWKQVPSARIHELFDKIIEPKRIGFTHARSGLLVCKISEDLYHAIKLDALKGASYGISYGVWLPYVPHPWAPKLRWHRTMKSAVLALRDQPQSWLQTPAGQGTGLTAFSMLGEVCFYDEFGAAWKTAWPRIEKWFAETVTLENVLLRADEQLKRQAGAICFLPEVEVVRAVTLGRLGRAADAKRELEAFFEQTGADEETRKNLQSALEKVARS